jgi:hypothetical protein
VVIHGVFPQTGIRPVKSTYRNGVIEHKKVEGGGFVPAQLPNNYLVFINTVANEINDQLIGAQRYADESYKKVVGFKNRFCITPVQPDEPAHYRDICGVQGDLTNAYSKITAMIASREARFSQIANNQRQTAIQAAQIQAINNQTEAINNQALSKSLNDLNNSLRQQTNSLYQNSYQAPAIPSYGQQPTYDTTCYNLGVVVRCNTR